MKKYDVIAEIKIAKLLKALYLPNIFSLSFLLHTLYKNAIICSIKVHEFYRT